jgi:hypothetical protein
VKTGDGVETEEILVAGGIALVGGKCYWLWPDGVFRETRSPSEPENINGKMVIESEEGLT